MTAGLDHRMTSQRRRRRRHRDFSTMYEDKFLSGGHQTPTALSSGWSLVDEQTSLFFRSPRTLVKNYRKKFHEV